MEITDKLPSCPFCGSTHSTGTIADIKDYDVNGNPIESNRRPCVFVKCIDVIIDLDVWQNRPAEAALLAEIERLGKELAAERGKKCITCNHSISRDPITPDTPAEYMPIICTIFSCTFNREFYCKHWQPKPAERKE